MTQPSSKTFQLSLNSITGFPMITNNSNTGDIFFSVDWDSFFNREQYNYKYCRVRIRYITNATTNLSYAQNAYVLVANFTSHYTSKNIPNVVLGLVTAYDGATILDTVGGTPRAYLQVDTLNESGVQIMPPTGRQTLNIALWQDGYGAIGNVANALSVNHTHFTAVLKFELYN
jgi:hypothetical protein